jgi:hypothetical protein
VYPKNAAPNKTTTDRQIRTFGTREVNRRKTQLQFWLCRLQAVFHLQQRDTTARSQYYYHWFCRFVHKSVHEFEEIILYQGAAASSGVLIKPCSLKIRQLVQTLLKETNTLKLSGYT